MILTGFVNSLNVTPAFVIPLFRNEGFGTIFYIQKLDRRTNKISAFSEISCDHEFINFVSPRNLEVGDDGFYSVEYQPNKFVSGNVEEIREFFEIENFESLPDSFRYSLSLLTNDGMAKDILNKLIFDLAKTGRLEEAIHLLDSAICMKGWDLIEENCYSNDSLNIVRSKLKNIDFYLAENALIAVDFFEDVELVEKYDFEIILEKLNEYFSPVINLFINNQLFEKMGGDDEKDSKSYYSERYGAVAGRLHHGKEVAKRFDLVISEMGRQEERLAFLVASLLHFPIAAKDLLARKDRAKSASIGYQYLRVSLREFLNFSEVELSNRVFDYESKLTDTLNRIISSWRSGDVDMFYVFLYKWILAARGEHGPPNAFFGSDNLFNEIFSEGYSGKFADVKSDFGNFYSIDAFSSMESFEEFSAKFDLKCR